MHDYAFIAAGLLTGFIVGLTGVGGGSLMTPLLMFGFKIQTSLAVGTDLLFAAGTKFSSTARATREGLVEWSVVASLCAGSIPASLITMALMRRQGIHSAEVQHIMAVVLGWALLLAAVSMLIKAVRGKAIARTTSGVALAEASKPRHWTLPILFGAFIGVLVSISSVGAGALGMTVLTMLYPRMPLPRVVAIDIAYAVPLTLVAGLGHASLGSVDWHMLAMLLIGSLPGVWLGSRLITKTPDRVIRSLLSMLLAYAGLKLIAI